MSGFLIQTSETLPILNKTTGRRLYGLRPRFLGVGCVMRYLLVHGLSCLKHGNEACGLHIGVPRCLPAITRVYAERYKVVNRVLTVGVPSRVNH